MDDLTLATIDRLTKIINRKCLWPDEREDVLVACKAIGIDPYDPEVDHHLADLYRALHINENNEMIYLSPQHTVFLNIAIEILGLE